MRNLTPRVDKYEALCPFMSHALCSRLFNWGFARAQRRPAGQLAASKSWVLCEEPVPRS